MKHKLSFGYVNILSENMAEIIVDEGVQVSLEMTEECDDFLAREFAGELGILVHRINNYSFTYEAQLNVASYEKIKAMAVVTYNQQGEQVIRELLEKRAMDGWNLKIFSGLELGWQQAYDWLQTELMTAEAS
ncbi:hypothetical protein SG34_024860 [Thalassomonas viridans]|uniref:STAS/SEC14 domain-containing protein n=1 Tax=Thalassomonas viridans TaxID=137584 RepID=A0AAF0C6S7_9GAMM|nr:hypothetical protein [Thalassomonas viridans]WDE04527.1 hypothetical protein SG34_024860 [Thalassomonas viridans]